MHSLPCICVSVEKDVAIVKICVNSVLLLASLIGLYAAAMSGFNSVTINTIINIIIITITIINIIISIITIITIILENYIITNTNCSLRISSTINHGRQSVPLAPVHHPRVPAADRLWRLHHSRGEGTGWDFGESPLVILYHYICTIFVITIAAFFCR